MKVFALHPGAHKTQLAEEGGVGFPDDITFDALQLPATTMLYLTSGRLDWLNGKSVQDLPDHALSLPSDELRYPARYLSANWDISEIERDWKEKIQIDSENALVSKLTIPK